MNLPVGILQRICKGSTVCMLHAQEDCCHNAQEPELRESYGHHFDRWEL